MRYFWRVFFALLGAAVVVSIALAAMLVVSSRQADLYEARVKIAFNAAALGYVSGDPARTVVTTYEGRSRELDPDAYRALSFYMRSGATRAFLPRSKDGAALSIVICGADTADIYRISPNEAYVLFCSSGKTMRMAIRGNGLWDDLVRAAAREAPPESGSE